MSGTEVIQVNDPRRREILAQYLSEQKLKKRGLVLPEIGEPRKTDRLNSVARPTVIDGHRFPSLKEARRYTDLKLEERAGLISHLQLQITFPLIVNGVKIFEQGYRADFAYIRYEKGGAKLQIEDSKGVITDTFATKEKLMLAIWGIKILRS